MVSSAPRVSPGLGGPARPYHISCLVGPKLKSSIAFSRLAKRASDTTAPSLTRPSACLVFSGVTKLRVPRSSSLPQRPQLESDCSIATTCSKVTRCAGSWVDGCDVIDVVAGAGAARCSWAAALPIWFANKDSPTSATVPAISFLVFVVRVFIASLRQCELFYHSRRNREVGASQLRAGRIALANTSSSAPQGQA